MAGVGINDAPARATADVELAMGTGTDVAIESAVMTLTGGDLTAIVQPRRLANATMRKYPPEPVLLVSVQRDRGADRRRRALSAVFAS